MNYHYFAEKKLFSKYDRLYYCDNYYFCSEYNDGFTLIEVSIVLVIIALIVGGILVGEDLIVSAKIRSEATQLQKFRTAVNSFRNKYDAVPGDILPADAARFGLGYTAILGSDSNGNGIIDYPLSNFIFWTEHLNFFSQLSKAKMIDGSYTVNPWGLESVGQNFPELKINSSLGILPMEDPVNFLSGHWMILGVPSFNFSSTVGWMNQSVKFSYTPIQAQNLDKKLDDGIPSSGTIVAVRVISNLNFSVDQNQIGGYPTPGPTIGSPPCLDITQTPPTHYSQPVIKINPAIYNVSTTDASNNISCLLAAKF